MVEQRRTQRRTQHRPRSGRDTVGAGQQRDLPDVRADVARRAAGYPLGAGIGGQRYQPGATRDELAAAAVRLVEGGQSIVLVAERLGLAERTVSAYTAAARATECAVAS